MQKDVLIAFIIFQAVFFLLDIYIYSKTTRDIARKGEYTFLSILIVIHMGYLVFNSLWSLQEYGAIHLNTIGMTALCMGSFLSITACAYVFFRFTLERISALPASGRNVQRIIIIPYLITAVLILLSPWTKWVFSLDEANTIVHGPLYTVMLGVSSLYLLAVIILAGHDFLTAGTNARRRASLSLFVSVLIIISFVVLDDFLPKVSILPVAVFSVITVSFINLLEANINTDALTGLFNRRKAFDYVSDQLRSCTKNNPLYLYMCDLNGFKTINDRYGHIEGDRALQLSGQVLRNAVSPYEGFCARYGGDEFLLTVRLVNGKSFDPAKLAQSISRNLEAAGSGLRQPYKLSMSIGWHICRDSAEHVNECVNQADEMLYEQKRAYHLKYDG